MGERLIICGELLRANRVWIARVVRHDAVMVAVALLYILSPTPGPGMNVSRGVFAALVLFVLAVLQAELLRRTAPGLRSVLVLPVRRETALGVFYGGFAAPGALALAAVGTAGVFAGRGWGDASVGAERILHAVLGLLFLKSLVVNLLVILRVQVFLLAAYLAVVVGMLLGILIVRDFVGDWIRIADELVAALFVAASFAFTFGVMHDAEF